MAGFIRRTGVSPGLEFIRAIEGVVVVDLAPPGNISGVGVGTVGMVGEFSDMSFATSASSAGVISTNAQPTEVFSAADLITKFGGFDETIGAFGASLGNGFCALRNKGFSRLVVTAINLASAQGSRFWRYLPLAKSQTDATPVVPVQGATVPAGLEFRNATARLRAGAKISFTARLPLATGIAGVTVAGASAAVQVFDADTGFDWTLVNRGDGTLGARKGDVLVIGNNNAGAVQPTGEAGTYRVQTDPASGIAITLQRMDGANFAFTAQTAVPWSLHHSTDADSAPERVSGSASPGGYAFGDNGGYVVPIRPITNASGAQSDGTFTAGTLISPAVTPPALTGSSADPLSGLGAALHPTTATQFTAAVQGINAAAASGLDALYSTAIDAMLSDDLPARDVNIIVAARKSSSIRSKLKQHVLTSSATGVGRTALIAPALTTVSIATATGDSDPGVGANRDERVDYCWPGALTSVPEAVGFLLGTADGSVTSDGLLDDSSDHWLAGNLSTLPPERNPGQAGPPVTAAMAGILGLQRGVSGLGLGEYTLLRQKGVVGLKIDRTSGPIFQSGVTTSLTAATKNINRRRMADFIEDSLAQALVGFVKQPLTADFKDSAVGEVTAFLSDLLSANNPAAQRISGFIVDDKSGNTPNLEAQGVFVIIVKVRTLATADFIVLTCQVGEAVNVTSLNG
jgi:hypothetical protein